MPLYIPLWANPTPINLLLYAPLMDEPLRNASCTEGKYHLCIPFLGIGRPPSHHIHVSVSDFYIPRIGPHISLQQKTDRSWKYINLSQIYECRNWETEHYNSVLEITVSFLGIHKWEPDFYTGFSPALHLKCGANFFLLVQLLSDYSALNVYEYPFLPVLMGFVRIFSDV